MKFSSAPQGQRTATARAAPAALAARSQPRRRIHGNDAGLPLLYPVAIEATSDGTDSKKARALSSKWQATLVGALIGLLIVMVLLMKWLLEFQVTAAAERRIQEAAVRAAAARCFELVSPGVVAACRRDLKIKGNSVD